MTRAARTTVARKASTARLIRDRFGASTFEALGFPGGEVVDAGLAELADGKVTAGSLLVSPASARLRREGVPLTTTLADPEDRLYALIAKRSTALAHARYNAYLRQMSSFADACRTVRLGRKQPK
jgi:hypothetical protein